MRNWGNVNYKKGTCCEKYELWLGSAGGATVGTGFDRCLLLGNLAAHGKQSAGPLVRGGRKDQDASYLAAGHPARGHSRGGLWADCSGFCTNLRISEDSEGGHFWQLIMADTGDQTSQTFSSWMCWRRGGLGLGLSREEQLKRGSVEVVALPMLSGQTSPASSWCSTIRPYNDVIKDIGGVTTDTQRVNYWPYAFHWLSSSISFKILQINIYWPLKR